MKYSPIPGRMRSIQCGTHTTLEDRQHEPRCPPAFLWSLGVISVLRFGASANGCEPSAVKTVSSCRPVAAFALPRDVRHSDKANGPLPSISSDRWRSERPNGARNDQFYALVAALAVFAPVAFATLNQAAQIVA